MTELLEKAMEKAHNLSPGMQDAIARMVLTYVGEMQAAAAPMPQRGSRQAPAVDPVKIDAITQRSSSRPLLDNRSAREILADAWGEPA